MNLTTKLNQIKGVGPKTASQLELAGLTTVGDMIIFLPRRHEDFSGVVPISQLRPGRVAIKARCEKISTATVRRGVRVTTAVLADDSAKVQAVWFNQPYRVSQLGSGDEFVFSGEFEMRRNRYQLTNPSAELAGDLIKSSNSLVAVYPSVRGLKSAVIAKIILELKPLIAMLPETLPPEVIKSNSLISRADALTAMHFADNKQQIEKARERLAFEELFSLLLASQLNRQQHTKLEGWQINFDQSKTKQFVASLPFELTSAQRRAAWDIIQDFASSTPMNRLLQGDVGSGKTVVAGLSAQAAASAGYQTAIMAPTEILARQHAETLRKLLEPFEIEVALLIGATKPAVRKAMLANIANGNVNVVVGTHALFQDKVEFSRLGFVVIDEQHRFGVEQRQRLLNKSAKLPHLLAMTATPIPRSLALTVYGELDLSILNEAPKGRLPIVTKLVAPASIETAYVAIEQQLVSGNQAYIITPLIDDNPDNDKKSVSAEFERLKRTRFARYRIGMLHGKMSPDEKEAIMTDFAAGEYHILVSTTVVEVGVDVPNATVIMIENADQFGLSQLHQLRGRVGRSDQQSYCFLVLSSSAKPSQRLIEIERSNDGFYLAEVDMELRGPGQIYGKAQHGALNLQIATLADTKLIARAQAAAKSLANNPNDLLQYKQLAADVEQYQRLTTLN